MARPRSSLLLVALAALLLLVLRVDGTYACMHVHTRGALDALVPD